MSPPEVVELRRQNPRLPFPASLGRVPSWLGTWSVGVLVPLCLFSLWKLSADNEWVPPTLLPAPRVVATTLLEQLHGDLFAHASISLRRVALGFALGGAIGLLLGIAMGLSARFEQYVYPFFTAVTQVPVLGWLPLAMMCVGIGESLKIVIIAHASLVPVALNTFKGVRGVPNAYVEVARAFRFSRAQLLRKVVLPSAVPMVFTGLRLGLTQAWLSLVTVELLASSEGLGFLIVWGRQLFQLDLVLAAIVVIGFVGLTLDKGFGLLEARLSRWRPALDSTAGARG